MCTGCLSLLLLFFAKITWDIAFGKDDARGNSALPMGNGMMNIITSLPRTARKAEGFWRERRQVRTRCALAVATERKPDPFEPGGRAAAHKGKALVLRWLGARQRHYMERRIRMDSASIVSLSFYNSCINCRCINFCNIWEQVIKISVRYI